MKKISLVIAFFAIGIFSSNAQVLKFGVKAGVNFSSLEGDNIEALDTYTSFHFGGLLEVKLLENFSIQPELLYSSQGAKVDVAGLEDINYNYITVPVLAKFYLISEKLSIEAGPQFAFLINEDVPDQFETESFDFAAVGGLGLNLTDHILVQARYVLGLTEADKEAEVTNRVIQLSVGYRF
ncbi:porin family protein [Flavobacterium sp.]|jgi:hypothetical protein|uniref:porin family protein n=1 Tax=Flavobacterium sp. TaxID=239 RepID=UPI0037BFEE51